MPTMDCKEKSLSFITLNTNDHKTLNQTYTIIEWIKKTIFICFLQETQLNNKETHKLKVKG